MQKMSSVSVERIRALRESVRIEDKIEADRLLRQVERGEMKLVREPCKVKA
jgi:hypothetical protein